MYNTPTDVIPASRASTPDLDANERQIHIILDNLYLWQSQVGLLQSAAVPKRLAALAGGPAAWAAQLALLKTDLTNAISRIRTLDETVS